MFKRIREGFNFKSLSLKKRGFSLIELIVVIAIIGILVMLASPKFLNRTKETTLAKHLYNVKTIEDTMDRYLLENNRFPRLSEEAYTSEQVEEYANRIRDLTGEEITLDPEGKYYDIDYVTLKDYVKIPDKKDMPNYILQNPVGKVFFLEGLTEVANNRADFTTSNPKNQEVSEEPVEPGKEFVPEGYVLATDDDFSGEIDGNFRYIGNDNYVVIPHIIKGVPVTSYLSMFSNSSVKGVASNNFKVTSMRYMFSESKSTELDLSNLNTLGVTNMQYMFFRSQATALDLSSFDTTNVTIMYSMFQHSQAITLDLSSFNTTNVTNMYQMFYLSQARVLDLSSFDMSNVTSMYAMLYDNRATKGYAKTKKDADKLNSHGNKSGQLTFEIK